MYVEFKSVTLSPEPNADSKVLSFDGLRFRDDQVNKQAQYRAN